MKKCNRCGAKVEGTAHAIDNENNHYCYSCCAEVDKENMRTENKIVLYLHENKITNWPGSLEIPVKFLKHGKHNMAKTRIDVWFKFEDTEWHGVQYGSSDELCYCTKLNKK